MQILEDTERNSSNTFPKSILIPVIIVLLVKDESLGQYVNVIAPEKCLFLL